MPPQPARENDFEAFIALAREVEPLFGPMADEEPFRQALRQAIARGDALCIRPEEKGDAPALMGGVVVSKESNEIAWLAVSGGYRGRGCGRRLLQAAIDKLDPERDMVVQTFDASVPEGKAARKLYHDFGFADCGDGGLNPAGLATVIMKSASKTQQ